MGQVGMYLKARLYYLVPLAILVAALALWWLEPSPLAELRMLVLDSFQRLEPRPYRAVPVRIVDIDDASLKRIGQWPWPRNELARLVERLHALGAAVIAFDIVFAEPDRASPRQLVDLAKRLGAGDPFIARLTALGDNDQTLAHVVADAKVVTGFVLTDKADPAVPETKASFAFAGDDPRPWVPRFTGAIADLPAIEAAAAGNASVNDLPEADGITRRAALLVGLGDKLYPSLALEALRVAQGAATYVVKSTDASGETGFGEHTGIVSIKTGDLVVPTEAHGTLWIHYTRHRPERFVPAWQVLDGSAAPAAIKDNIVFVGSSAEGLNDLHSTPLDPVAPGVEIQAQIAEQLLLGDALVRPDWTHGAEGVYMLALGLALLWLLPKAGARWSGALGGSAIAAAFGVSWYLFSAHRLLIDPVFPSLTLLLVYLSSSAAMYLRTEAERQRVRAAFSRYLAPSVVEQLASHPERLRLGGEMREMTLMFCDIRGFTTISEGFDAEGLTGFINRFLTPMSDVILAAGGTIDKYMGDCIMAFWNAPLDDPAHAAHACGAALAMRAALAELNASRRREAASEGKASADIRVGIGLNTGMCCVGNMGSEHRFDYSVLGDDVNLASRLEAQSKTYGVDIVVGERTAEAAGALALLELDLIRVKGKTRPVRIYAVVGDGSVAARPDFAALKENHDAMLGAYRSQRWAEAARRLAACQAAAPEALGALFALYAERIAAFSASPPPADWDGVYVALTK